MAKKNQTKSSQVTSSSGSTKAIKKKKETPPPQKQKGRSKFQISKEQQALNEQRVEAAVLCDQKQCKKQRRVRESLSKAQADPGFSPGGGGCSSSQESEEGEESEDNQDHGFEIQANATTRTEDSLQDIAMQSTQGIIGMLQIMNGADPQRQSQKLQPASKFAKSKDPTSDRKRRMRDFTKGGQHQFVQFSYILNNIQEDQYQPQPCKEVFGLESKKHYLSLALDHEHHSGASLASSRLQEMHRQIERMKPGRRKKHRGGSPLKLISPPKIFMPSLNMEKGQVARVMDRFKEKKTQEQQMKNKEVYEQDKNEADIRDILNIR